MPCTATPLRLLFLGMSTAIIASTMSLAWAGSPPPAVYSKDFVAGFQKGSDDARAYTERAAKELDATFNFSKHAIDGQLPPALKNMDKNAPLIYRCTMKQPSEINFAVIAVAQPLCKEKNADAVCTKTLSWRDFLMDDLAPKNPPNTRPVEREDDFNNGEAAAKNTALDNMTILNDIYMGMGIYRTLEQCGPPSSKK